MDSKINTNFKFIDNFKEIISSGKYKGVFFDAYGVLNDCTNVFPYILPTLKYLQQLNIPYMILSNDASRSTEHVINKFNKHFSTELFSDNNVILAGDPILNYLDSYFNKKELDIVYLGPDESEYFLHKVSNKYNIINVNKLMKVADTSYSNFNYNIDVTSLDKLDNMDVFIIMDDQGFEWKSSLNFCLNLLRKFPNALLVCPNTDLLFVSNNNLSMLGSGSIAHLFEIVDNRFKFKMLGKPSSEYFNYAINRMNNINKDKNTTDCEYLMVGDTLSTDILGANNINIDSCLVLSGNTEAAGYIDAINTAGITPTYVCPSIKIE